MFCSLRFASFLVLLMLCGPTRAGDDWQTWGAVIATASLGRDGVNLRYWLEGQGRFNDGSSRFGQGLLRAGLGYRWRERTVVWGGYALVPTERVHPARDTLEHRFWQQMTWDAPAPYAGFSLASRTRLEQRRIDGADGTGWRARQLLKGTRPLGAGTRWYLSVWDEVFVNLNTTAWGAHDGFDQNRAFLGTGVRLSTHTRAEFGYLYQVINRAGQADAHNHILSITALLNF